MGVHIDFGCVQPGADDAALGCVIAAKRGGRGRAQGFGDYQVGQRGDIDPARIHGKAMQRDAGRSANHLQHAWCGLASAQCQGERAISRRSAHNGRTRGALGGNSCIGQRRTGGGQALQCGVGRCGAGPAVAAAAACHQYASGADGCKNKSPLGGV
ncbi:MAG: hypothetical protein CFE43_16475 [Burkholderiales bacterium PBB3]|nr:MAG: hypothetical protein CFE43_16475 [Burkholderiales bacterium PBB3]